MTAASRRDRVAVIDGSRAKAGTRNSDRARAVLRLTPHGRLVFEDTSDAPDLDAKIALRLREAFARGSGEGLWRLARL